MPDDIKEETEYLHETKLTTEVCNDKFDPSKICEPKPKETKRGKYDKLRNYHATLQDDVVQEVEDRIRNFESKMLNSDTDPQHKEQLAKQILHERAKAEVLKYEIYMHNIKLEIMYLFIGGNLLEQQL